MFEVVSSYKSDHIFFATVKLDEDHSVYLSAYGTLASGFLEKYIENQREDYEELFAEWDKSVKKAGAQVGFSATHEVEDGHIYVSSFQAGIGIAEEDAQGSKSSASHN